jgi:hypothetical protein
LFLLPVDLIGVLACVMLCCVRTSQVNAWLGLLLRNFNLLPRDGKELITDFLGMPSFYSDAAAMAPEYTLVHSM